MIPAQGDIEMDRDGRHRPYRPHHRPYRPYRPYRPLSSPWWG